MASCRTCWRELAPHDERVFPRLVHGLCTRCRRQIQETCPHPDVQPMVVWRANGTPDLRSVCQRCGSWWGGLKLADVPDWENLEVWRDHRGQGRPCERCRTGVSEYHHWAPRALFADSEEWPGGWLCPTCHRHWHATMRQGVAAG